jgi:hypothetical protein
MALMHFWRSADNIIVFTMFTLQVLTTSTSNELHCICCSKKWSVERSRDDGRKNSIGVVFRSTGCASGTTASGFGDGPGVNYSVCSLSQPVGLDVVSSHDSGCHLLELDSPRA